MNAGVPKPPRMGGLPNARPISDSTAELGAELGEYELIVTGNGSVSRVPLVSDCPLLLGRGEDADLCLRSGSVSRRHARIILRGSELVLEDLDSTNGTLVQGQRLTTHRETSIGPGESFSVGEFVLVLNARRDNRSAQWNPARGDAILRSREIIDIYQQLEPVARSGMNVLILGETGVGKDVFARAVHANSERRDKPFLRLNCAAFSEALLESELFGHEKGAFTGAVSRKPGLLTTATGGSVFLDEVGELPLCLQAKVLHVLETQEVLSVGGLKPYSIDVRFIAATNRDLELDAVSGAFRSDLYYRLAAYTVVIPPLRNRHGDILPLAHEFLRRAAEKAGSPSVPSIRADAEAELMKHSWPGNLRELRNVVERALVLSGGAVVGPDHLQIETPRNPSRTQQTDASEPDQFRTELSPRELQDRQRILEALRACAGNQSAAAAKLGLSRSTLINRLDAYRISRPRKRQA